MPGLCGFIGEVLVTLSAWNFSHTLAIISAATVILTAGYILWTIQRVYLGAEYKGPHGDHLYPITRRELAIAAPLLAFAILFGVYPQALFNYMTPTIKQQADTLAEWTKDVKKPAADETARTHVEAQGLQPLGLAAISHSQQSNGTITVNLSDLVNSLLHDTTGSLALYRPELTLCATIVLMLLLRVFRATEKINAFYIALIGAAVGLWFSAPWQQLDSIASISRQELFTGMLVYDSFTIYFRTILLFFAVLFVIFTRLSGVPEREDAADFYTLVLGGTVGMCLMATANHLVIIFLGVEMASVPSYALAGMLKSRPRSSEAALKYSVYGAGAAGIMLYGISLLAGVLGTCHLPTMAQRLAEGIAAGTLTQPLHGDGAGRFDDWRGAGVQVVGVSVSLLVPRRVRRGHGGSERVSERGFQSGGIGAVGARGGWVYHFAGESRFTTAARRNCRRQRERPTARSISPGQHGNGARGGKRSCWRPCGDTLRY